MICNPRPVGQDERDFLVILFNKFGEESDASVRICGQKTEHGVQQTKKVLHVEIDALRIR